jgi:hypothetical protein
MLSNISKMPLTGQEGVSTNDHFEGKLNAVRGLSKQGLSKYSFLYKSLN